MKAVFRLGSGIFSAFGLLSLIEQFDLVKIKSQVAAWLRAFRLLTDTISGWFDWIDFGGFQIERYEVDYLVFASIVFSAFSGAATKVDPAFHGRILSIFSLIMMSLCFILVFWLIPCMIFPGYMGIVVCSIFLIVLVLSVFFPKLQENEQLKIPSRLFVEQLSGSFVAFIGLLGINLLLT